MVIKYVKFLDSATHTEKVYFTAEKMLQESAPEFAFETPEEAIAKSTVETFLFWDNAPIGAGTVAE